MDELTGYIINNYFTLMTFFEKAAYKMVVLEEKAQHAHSDQMRQVIQQNIISSDPKVAALLENGSEVFFYNVRERILREQADYVVLNNCQQCGALARTPQAKQCPKCFYHWHDQT